MLPPFFLTLPCENCGSPENFRISAKSLRPFGLEWGMVLNGCIRCSEGQVFRPSIDKMSLDWVPDAKIGVRRPNPALRFTNRWFHPKQIALQASRPFRASGIFPGPDTTAHSLPQDRYAPRCCRAGSMYKSPPRFSLSPSARISGMLRSFCRLVLLTQHAHTGPSSALDALGH